MLYTRSSDEREERGKYHGGRHCQVVQPREGYGFISQNDGEDLFVHFSEIKMSGFKTLNEGDAVTFEVTEGQNGKLQASNVERI